MAALIYLGAAMALAGIGLLVWCMRRAFRLRQAEVPAPQVQAELRVLIVMNMGAVGLGFLGLALVVVGVVR